MSTAATLNGFSDTAIIIPALDEAESLSVLLPALATVSPGQTIVCDNGSTDATREVVRSERAEWVYVARRGYGAACQAGLRALAPSVRTVVFMDADQNDAAALLPGLVLPIVQNECDLVIGARVGPMRESGSMTILQRFANWLLPKMILWGWGHRYSDLGPLRAIRRSSLEAIGMRDRAYGWTIEMQIRAVELGLRIREIPVPYRKRTYGESKIAGTVRGTLRAGYWLMRTCTALWLTKRRRLRGSSIAAV